jgi:hypothetical protein
MSFAFSDQLDKLSRLLGDPNTSSDDQWPLADRKKELNRGELQFALDSKNVKEYASGTIADKEISLPADWLETKTLIITIGGTEYLLTNKNEISVNQRVRYTNYADLPPKFYVWEFSGTRKMKLLGPTSLNGAAYELFYIKKPTTELSADADVSLLPEEFREGPCYYAARELLLQIGQTQLAAQFDAMYSSFVQKAKDQIDERDVDNPMPLVDTGDEYENETVDTQGN